MLTAERTAAIFAFACVLGGAAGTTLFACAAPDFHEDARMAAPEARMLAIQVTEPAA